VKRALLCLLAACGGDDPTAPEPPPWDRTLPVARELGGARGLVPARGIVHLHSPYSHDACDGNPRDDDGVPNEPCLQDLRAALCATHIDFAALTDHDDTMADEDFVTLLSMRGDDVPVMANGRQIASHMTCADGHVVTFTVGGENDMMPIMLDDHVAGTIDERHALYNNTDGTAAAAFRTAGGLSWFAHTESKPIELLRVAADGLEVYNLHANIDPDIRRDFLGLDPSSALADAAEFADTNPGHPEPDLAMLAFLTPNQPAIDKWQTLLGEGRRIPVTNGSDAHQNAIPITFADGERGDSYRRVMRWFSNVALVTDPTDPLDVQDAFATGRLFTAFEILGSPVGFTTSVELGSVVAAGSDLTVTLPAVFGLDPALPAPTIRARVFHVAPGGNATVIAETGEPSVTLALADPGAYRIEISMVPSHLGPYLHDLGTALVDQELPWIYASPIYVE
jgi:hypothetical protein